MLHIFQVTHYKHGEHPSLFQVTTEAGHGPFQNWTKFLQAEFKSSLSGRLHYKAGLPVLPGAGSQEIFPGMTLSTTQKVKPAQAQGID